MSFLEKMFGGKSENEKMLDEVCKQVFLFLNDDDEQNKTLPVFLERILPGITMTTCLEP